ncbi:hypothetical protein A3C37_03210 [Candidatus Peribacteria bacterium RIFCSPHIGHO2_02_FULL_53_20]|nr:MAG: hypothetical protein A3C37_03210 [Candidatus Peribacteria bacterium RIFCSPHIGHO2_02_FULL_53_20]OGJ67419.1 MAG: hypothetical protein A3B61_00620 [Candidatus Peribacteria bacterium RIFCSPLOWO2_01_FULL_53_10]OGJ72603.1 MAG: hypothetical protein A3G69_01645 [Candidatus Peribacteria bacterium RIFCSPLOWO2_12_FULL_53_10]
MGNSDTAPEKKAKSTRAEVLGYAKTGVNKELLKEQIAKMEGADRAQLLNDIKMEKDKLALDPNLDLSKRLVDLEDEVRRQEQSFSQSAQETVGSAINTGIDSLAKGAKKGTEFVGNQVKKGTDAMAQIGEQAVNIMNDPNLSKEEKRVHVIGLAAAVAVPAGILYWGLSKLAGKGLQSGQKPSLGRRLLQVTGFAFLASLGVRFIAPFVSEKQKQLIASKGSSTVPEKSVPPKDQQKSPENPAALETVRLQGTFQGTDLKVVERGGAQLIKIGEKHFRITRVGEQQNLVGSITGMRTREQPSQLVFNNLATIEGEDFTEAKAKLAAASKDVTVQIPARGGDRSKIFDLEFTLEQSA